MALKLDISKAYDKVEWKFLEKVLVSLVLFSLNGGSAKAVPFHPICSCYVQRLSVLCYRGKREWAVYKVWRNTPSALREGTQGTWQIRVENRHDLYLGLPSVVGGQGSPYQSGSPSDTTYAMGCFRLPISLVKEIQSMVANYWWHNGETKKIHWLSWKKMCIPKALGGMGFRDLHAFNLAMLSKQVWRILLFLNSLLSQVLRARYFHDGEVFSAKRGRNPSFTWRSLHAAIDIVRGGFRWGIGSGRSVKVWQDPRLPRPFSFHILTPPGANDPHLRVCDLIDDSSKDWDQTLVRNLFWHDEAESILAIPLSSVEGEDFFVWHHTATGMFSVKSAYHVAVSLANRNQPSTSHPVPSPWKAVWSANVPGKVRVFIWKLAQNALPTGSNLFKKLREVVLACLYCGSEEEDTEHVFLRCPFARQVWALSNLRWSFISNYPAPCGWWNSLLKLCPGMTSPAASICWAIWWNRNRALMEQSYLSAGDLLSFATNYLASFKQLTASSSKVTHQAPPVRWSPPGLDEVKLNFDGAIFASSVEVGIGIIARDSVGACVGWKSVRKQGLFDPEMVEAMAARGAILLAWRVGWRRIILEGDCANIYQKLSALSPDCSALGAIIRDIKCLALNFDLCSFSLVRRSGNKVAHCLARRASLFASEGSSISPALFELCSLMLSNAIH
ncbi:UNVERIFIED_CONTAM: putative mitochondrial protein [Sesamum radiatum]|uniref:Mitochondrial protein n=1 Tax=Sesamum radiatum TaxID=300843 RepID=A0AAW2KNV9_SESRA